MKPSCEKNAAEASSFPSTEMFASRFTVASANVPSEPIPRLRNASPIGVVPAGAIVSFVAPVVGTWTALPSGLSVNGTIRASSS